MRKKIISAMVIGFIIFLAATSFSSPLIKGNLKNGLAYRIFLKSSLPIVSIDVRVKSGSIFDPVGKFGLAYVVGHSLENCSTPMLTSKQLREMFDKYGIESSVSVGKGYTDITVTGLSENIRRIFCLLHEILNSKFDKKGISFVKREAINQIISLRNNKDYLAIHAAFVGLISQSSISHTSIGTINGIRNIKREDVLKFYKNHFKPTNMVISISGGGFDPQYAIKEIKYYFSDLNSKNNLAYGFVEPVFRNGLHITDIVRPQTRQSYIYFAFPSFGCCSKNYYAARILAHILGGGLNSILMKDIRTKHGYAYSAFAFNYQLPKKGVFVIGLQTQNKFTLRAIDRVFADIKDIDKYITPKMVKLAKDYFSGSVPIALQSQQAIAASLSEAYFKSINGLPWLHFIRSIDSVTTSDVKKVARMIFENSISIGIVSYKKFDKQIKSIAEKYGYR